MIIGIDLGTSTTEAAIYRNGKVEMIPNKEGAIVTPSAVGLDENGELIVGERALSQYIVSPERTAIEIKRKLGKNERIKLGKNNYTPIELSSVLLSYIRSCATEYLGEDITRAVISVPAYFDDIQRQEVVKAGEMAGFTVERIINEPTAAALSYGISHLDEESHILVYDLGGGTFDVTLLEMFDGILEVKASSGDNQLGGKDFDQCLIDFLRESFEKANGVCLEKDVYALARLKEQAEKCKKELSSEEVFTVSLPMLAKKDNMPLALEEAITRQQFEELIKEFILKTHIPVNTVLSDGEVTSDELDMILLVGGSTRIPLVKKDIANFLGQEPARAVHPDYSVAEGAAIQAAILNGDISQESGIIMTDVNPYSLGIRTVNDFTTDYMSVVIPRNTTIPVTKKETYYTFVDNQAEAAIEIYQGEFQAATKNHFLGKFVLGGIPANKAGKESLEVSFSYDLNGLLKVEALIISTGKAGNISINMLESGETARIDVQNWKSSPCAEDFRTVIRRGEKLLKKLNAQKADEWMKKRCQELDELLYQIKKAVIEENKEEAEDLEEEIEVFMEEV